MRLRVFLDTNVFIYAFEFPRSNSAKVIELLNENRIEAVVSEQVLKEVVRYFKKHHSKDLASLYRLYLLESCVFVLREDIKESMKEFRGEIKDKDLEQLAVVKEKGIKYLISYDRDFEPFEEYVTPKKFVEITGKKASDTEY